MGDTIFVWEAAFCLPHYNLGFDLCSYLYVDEPGLISEWMEIQIQNNLKFIEKTVSSEFSPLAVFGCDIGYKDKLLFSPALLEKEFFPRLARYTDAYHKKGIKVIFHSDGNIMEVLDDLISAGIDGLNPIEPLAGMDIKELKQKYGDKLILTGNIDCSQLLPYGIPEEVRKVVKETIEVAGEGGGYLFGSSSELHPDIPLENIKAMYKAAGFNKEVDDFIV